MPFLTLIKPESCRSYRILLPFTVLSFFLSLSPAIIAQNTYWTTQYGAFATLTGGAFLSPDEDNSVFINNPGAIGFMDSSSINITANLYAFNRFHLKNAVGKGRDLISNKLDINAQVMAGTLTFKKFPRLHFMYGYVLKNFTRIDFEQQNVMYYDVIPESPGMEFYRAKIDFSYNFQEYWGGIAAGYRINDHISVGLGHYGGFIGLKALLFQETSTDAINPLGIPYTASVKIRYKYNLNHVYLLFKPGVDIRFGKHRLSVTAIMPSIKFWSNGRVYQSLELSNMHYYYPNPNSYLAYLPSFSVTGDQRNVQTNYRLAPSISIGYSKGSEKFRFSMATEYFFKVKEYDLIRGREEVYARPATAFDSIPLPDFMRIRSGSYAVLNLAFGIDAKISPKVRLLAGFRTDFNNKIQSYSQDSPNYVGALNPQYWSYLHYSFGIALDKGKSRTFIGLTYKQGISLNKKAFSNFDEPTLINNLVGLPHNDMRTSVHGIGLVIGYTHFSNGGMPGR